MTADVRRQNEEKEPDWNIIRGAVIHASRVSSEHKERPARRGGQLVSGMWHGDPPTQCRGRKLFSIEESFVKATPLPLIFAGN